ncbi:hypothetical protein THAOC_28060 [Thalassiosira oceanica]|uniref:Uncharacterized protein n=1 Tax=Thalassiosira oceanica TaxID=159749 RepID=K0RHC7_THAOC|nr:hypothetical protein THAOC_28060 [Thalassiosira oceanica]|mmetsp:Transcript_2052/g.4905  ORF Transcript_2052/g.4905 Transcript_2052/m.4905 type:complete len:361 (-) Transcript_2052:8-1090(-)|eukprot:EJK52635.1 hypothetical protein THAOC_28060 [Thalassiosira oceanica]
MQTKKNATEQIHQMYRRSVSNYLAHTADLFRCRRPPNGDGACSLTAWMNESSRDLALRAAQPIAANFDAKTYTTSKKMQKRKRSEIRRKQTNKLKVSASDVYQSLNPQWEDFICMTCGTFLIPPIDQSTITSSKGPSESDANGRERLPDVLSLMKAQVSSVAPLPDNIFLCNMKRGRTRRRRASRAKAKQLYKRALSLERRGSTNNISLDMQWELLLEEKMNELAYSFNVNDGRALSCLVLECGQCGTRHKRKGLEVIGEDKEAKLRSSNRAVEKSPHNKISSFDAKKNATKRAHALSSQSDNKDFISLSSPWQSSGRQSRASQSKRKNPDSILLSGGKKKKKKQQSRSNLQDFLSSLND